MFCDEKLLKIFFICVFIFSKRRRNWFYENLYNSGLVGRRKLLDPSLNRIFNALSIGVQYMLSFQLTDFDLKYLLQSHLFSAFSSFQTSNVSFAFHVLSPFLGSSPSEVFVSSNFYFRIIPFKFSFAPRFSFTFMWSSLGQHYTSLPSIVPPFSLAFFQVSRFSHQYLTFLPTPIKGILFHKGSGTHRVEISCCWNGKWERGNHNKLCRFSSNKYTINKKETSLLSDSIIIESQNN